LPQIFVRLDTANIGKRLRLWRMQYRVDVGLEQAKRFD